MPDTITAPAQPYHLDRDTAQRVRDTVDAGLCCGLGEPIPGKMCVEAAVCYALNLPHGDNPPCVGPAVQHLKMRLNDSHSWLSDAARAKGLRRLAIAQLGSDTLSQKEFATRVVTATIRAIVPIALRAAGKHNSRSEAALEAAAVNCEQLPIMMSMRAAVTVVDAAYAACVDADACDDSADSACAAYSAYSAACAAAYASADAADAVYAACAAAYAAADAAADAADAVGSNTLSHFAELVVGILVDMGSLGCQWLDLVPLEAETPPTAPTPPASFAGN